jgi:radical SAM superfamily enzyme YgiQ (UPF0313 family)
VKIYLVTPKNPPSFWTYDHILPTLGKRCIFPNLSMPTIGGLTPRKHEVVLCDENVEEIDFDTQADIVGVTGYVIHQKRIREIAAEFRRRGRFVVIGGPFASLCPEELRESCDVLFTGEAEETWPQFLRDFEKGVWKTEYQTLEMPDLTNAPSPRFDLLKVDRYHALTIQFARGCPFNCEFCDIIVLYGRRPRTKGVDRVMDEVRECHRLGAKQVFVVDDNFIGNKKQAKALLREMARWGKENGYPVDFNTEVSLNVAQDDELLDLLRAAHFTTVFVGIESPRADSLKEAQKTQNMRGDLVESVHKIQARGIQVQAGMIVGFDNDDVTIFEEQLRFIQEAGIPVCMTGMLQAMTKTPLHARIKKEGRLIAESTGDQFVFSNIIPKGMSRAELYRGYRKLITDLYDSRHFRARALEFLMRRGSHVKEGMRIGRDDLGVFFRILRDTVFRTSARRAWYTLSLIGTILLRRPRAFRDAVSFAVVYKALADYAEELGQHLDREVHQIEATGHPVGRAAGPRLA